MLSVDSSDTVGEETMFLKIFDNFYPGIFIGCRNYAFLKTKNFKKGRDRKRCFQTKNVYIYFEQLLFLEPLAQQRKTTSNLETGDADETRTEVLPSTNNTTQKKKNLDKEDEVIKVLQQRILTAPNTDTIISQDDDTLFCLSLVSDFKKILDDMKTDAKCEVLQVLNKYKRVSAPAHGHTTQSVPYNNLGHSSQKAQYNNLGPNVTSSVYLQQAYANTHTPSASGIAQQQHQSVPQMPQNSSPISSIHLASTVTQPQRVTQTQANIHIPLISPTYSSVSSPDSLNTYSAEGYEDISQNDSQDNQNSIIITDLF
ncbi:unnamed protein product [Acanthoscelides obtectus]|uniref:BESS domain-containing protein n=1 Tax=Acanthoscelides obtectus TaxID=200917 RepID=A0A9P0PKE8_ACAOB|nr:unnamed protein product [Acanthoscelides obtectus]CAK1627405.1 hypothetical protein AOBTE_LOCUS4578 [Acanthoscelides obtectus]